MEIIWRTSKGMACCLIRVNHRYRTHTRHRGHRCTLHLLRKIHGIMQNCSVWAPSIKQCVSAIVWTWSSRFKSSLVLACYSSMGNHGQSVTWNVHTVCSSGTNSKLNYGGEEGAGEKGTPPGRSVSKWAPLTLPPPRPSSHVWIQ